MFDSNARTKSRMKAVVTFGAKATAMTQRLAGIWVKTIVLISPIRLARTGAASWDSADKAPVQKKKAPAAANEMPKRWNSHKAKSDWTKNPLPNESKLKIAANA